MPIDVDKKINILEGMLSEAKKMKSCDHDFYVETGDNLSTTGPTGLYKCCRNCAYHEEVGYIGVDRKIFYENDCLKQGG
jgi:hypothetical protein